MAQQPIRSSCNNEPTEEVQFINISSTSWDRLPNRSHKTNDVDEDACDVGGISAPMETGSEYDEDRAAGHPEFKGGEITETAYGKRDLEM